MYQEIERGAPITYTLEKIREALPEEDEDLQGMCEDVAQCTDRYLLSVLAYQRINPNMRNKDVEIIDSNRRITHNSLCDKLRILARLSQANGVNTEWWDGPGGMRDDRNIIKQWALKTAFNRLRNQVNEERQGSAI